MTKNMANMYQYGRKIKVDQSGVGVITDYTLLSHAAEKQTANCPASVSVFGGTGRAELFLTTTVAAPWRSAWTYTSFGFMYLAAVGCDKTEWDIPTDCSSSRAYLFTIISFCWASRPPITR